MALEFKHEDRPGHYIITMLKYGENIGDIFISKEEDLPPNPDPHTRCWQVKGIDINPELRRQGYATRLYEEALEVALAHGVALCSDYAGQIHPDADRFWNKQVAKGRAYWEVPGPDGLEGDENFDYGRYVIDKPQPTLSGKGAPKKPQKNKKTALVIIHLSSLDSYTDLGMEAGRGMDPGFKLAERLSRAILSHDGPVIIADQGWAFFYKDSRPREDLLFSLEYEEDYPEGKEIFTQESPREITWIHFDEDEQEWDWFLDALNDILHDQQVDEVVLGGLFFEPDLSEGCVTYTYQELKKVGIPVNVDPKLVGCVSDFYTTEELPGGYTRGTKNKKR